MGAPGRVLGCSSPQGGIPRHFCSPAQPAGLRGLPPAGHRVRERGQSPIPAAGPLRGGGAAAARYRPGARQGGGSGARCPVPRR